MIHTEHYKNMNDNGMLMTKNMLVGVVLATAIFTCAVLSLLPMTIFLVIVLISAIGWYFHRPILHLLGTVKAEHRREINPHTNEQVINFQNLKSNRKNSSLRVFFGKAANSNDLAQDNVISFPSTKPSNR